MSEQHIQQLKFSFIINEPHQLVIKAVNIKNNLTYIGSIITNPYIDFTLVIQQLHSCKYNITTHTQQTLSLRIGAIIIQLVCEQKKQLKTLNETLQKCLQKQTRLQYLLTVQGSKVDSQSVQIDDLIGAVQQMKKLMVKLMAQYHMDKTKTINQQIIKLSGDVVTTYLPVLQIQVNQKQQQSSSSVKLSQTPLHQVRQVIKATGPIDQIVELNLSDIKINKFTAQIKSIVEKCKNLQILILANCQLQSLDNMPQTDLTAIDLTCNKLNDSQLVKLVKYQNLGQLLLNQNKIQKLQSLQVLNRLQHLQQIDLSDNPIAKVKNYRNQVFRILSQLGVLDRFDREGKEVNQEDYGQFSQLDGLKS